MATAGPGAPVSFDYGETNRRKSGRSIRKPDLYSQEVNEGSSLSNGSFKRKRTPLNSTTNGEGLERSSIDSSEEESEGEADEEELKEMRRAKRTRKPSDKPAAKRSKPAKGHGTALAIRSANLQGKAASKSAKVQKARTRQSQVVQQGLYG